MKLATRTKLPERIQIALLLYPDLELAPEGHLFDIHGLDAYLNGKRIQCKHDTAIARTNNIYHEMYEKTALKDRQTWRHTAANVDAYIFTSETPVSYVGYYVAMDTLAAIEKGKTLVGIYPNKGALTSLGFLLPLREFNPNLSPKYALKEWH